MITSQNHYSPGFSPLVRGPGDPEPSSALLETSSLKKIWAERSPLTKPPTSVLSVVCLPISRSHQPPLDPCHSHGPAESDVTGA